MKNFNVKFFYIAILTICPLLFVTNRVISSAIFASVIVTASLFCIPFLFIKSNRHLKSVICLVVSFIIGILSVHFIKYVFPNEYNYSVGGIYVSVACACILNSSLALSSEKYKFQSSMYIICMFIIVYSMVSFIFETIGNGRIFDIPLQYKVEFFGSVPFGFIFLGIITFVFNVIFGPIMKKKEIYDNLLNHYKQEIISKENKK